MQPEFAELATPPWPTPTPTSTSTSTPTNTKHDLPQNNINKTPNLSALPTEIVQMIANYLSPVDTASFTLCSHTFLQLLGCRNWKFPDPTTRTQFLFRLERDCPPFFYCESCSLLHPRVWVGPPGPAFQPDKSLISQHAEKHEPPSLWRSVDVHPMHSLYDFNFAHLQLAMKRFHYGPDHGISTESLSYIEVRFFEERAVTTLLSVEPRICCSSVNNNDTLCLRIQNWALVGNTPSPEEFVSKIGFIWLCTHLSIRDSNISQFVKKELDAYYNSSEHGIPSSSSSSPNVFKCRMCSIDYQLEIRQCGNEGPALVITKWLDLGTGNIPMANEWKRHLGTSPIPENGLCLESAGDIVSLFDNNMTNSPGLSLDSLTHRNESYLVGRRFMDVMDWWDQKTWILQGEDRLPCDYPRPPAPVPDRASKLKESTDAIKDLTAQIALLSRTVEEKTKTIQALALSHGV